MTRTASGTGSSACRRIDDWDDDRLQALAEKHGTPLFVTDLNRVQANYRRFAAAFDHEHVLYAAKANTGRAVLRTLLDAGADLECGAAGELRRAVAAGANPNDLQYTAVNPPAEDLDVAVNLWTDGPGLTITAGAVDTLDRLAERGFDGRLLVRVNPGVGAGHHEKVATGADAKFGVPADRVAEVVDRAREEFAFVGLHAHVGSGILGDDLANHRRAMRRVGEIAREVGSIEVLDVGGGFGVPYRPDEVPLDLDRVATASREALGPVDARLALEPGRYVVADAGVLLTRVNTRKEAAEAVIVGTDASMSTLLRPAMFDAYHPIRTLGAGDREREPVTVAGPLCTSADVFCEGRPLASPRRGDLLAIGNAGAYGYEFTSTFHSRPRPAEVALDGGEARIVRDRETVEDLTRLERS
ncbi:MAG: diaminopimelate decarboxylase [Halobacteriales archaeon]|jgi:diaminopimelate decarboxylase